jgi:hypothetical protein
MSVIWLRARLGALLAGLAVTGLVAAAPREAAGKENLLAVEWTNPEIESFVKEQATAPRRSLGTAADDKLSKVKLPVIAFGAIPGLVENTFRIGPKPAAERDVVVDEKNPVWYQIIERYGDMTVSVEADLRVQHEFPESYPVYDDARRGAGPQAGPNVSVFDDENEDGVDGLIAEYTVTKFGIPYTVTIECSAAAKAQCHDTGQISKDSELLKLVRANPPAP